MIIKHTIEDVFLSNKLDIERTLLFLNYSLETISQADINKLQDHHLDFLKSVAERLSVIRQDIDNFLENDPELFNIEPSLKNNLNQTSN